MQDKYGKSPALSSREKCAIISAIMRVCRVGKRGSVMSAEAKEQSREQIVNSMLEEVRIGGVRTIDSFAERLNMEVLWAGPEEAEGVMRVTPEILNPYGTVHGGCLSTLADTVSGHNVAAAGRLCVTLSCTMNFLRSANCQQVRCHSKIRKLGKRISVVDVEQWDEKENLLTTASYTFSTFKEIPPHIITPRDDNDSEYFSMSEK